jgi:hypothetical protein
MLRRDTEKALPRPQVQAAERQRKSTHRIDSAAPNNQKLSTHGSEQRSSWLEFVRRKLDFLQSGRERRKQLRQKQNAIYAQNAYNGNDSAILRGLVELYTEELRKAIDEAYETGAAILAKRQLMTEQHLLELLNQLILPQIRGGAAGVRDSLQRYAWRTGVTVADPIYLQALRDAEESLEELERRWCKRIEIEAAELAMPQSVSTSTPEPGSDMSLRLERGARCERLAGEIKRIRRLHQSGQRISEIRQNYPDFLIWSEVETLPSEDRDTFNRPGTWGPVSGYANLLLGKIYDNRSPHTVNDWRKEYRRYIRQTRNR